MTEREPLEAENLDRYGSAALDWSRARDALAHATGPAATFFVGTCRPDGTPDAAGVGAMWHEGDIYFISGPGMRKARNLASNPRCTISVRLQGIDLVLAGTAARTTERAVLEALATRYREAGWPARVEGDALTAPFCAPSAGPPPWHLYRCRVHTVTGVATAEPTGATRWRFAV